MADDRLVSGPPVARPELGARSEPLSNMSAVPIQAADPNLAGTIHSVQAAAQQVHVEGNKAIGLLAKAVELNRETSRAGQETLKLVLEEHKKIIEDVRRNQEAAATIAKIQAATTVSQRDYLVDQAKKKGIPVTDATVDPYEEYKAARSVNTVEGARSKISESLGRHFGAQVQDAEAGLAEYDPIVGDDGSTITGWTDRRTGEVLSPDDPTILDRVRQLRGAEAGLRMAQNLSKPGGIKAAAARALGSSEAGMVAVRAAGYVGAAYSVADQVKDFAIGQREANLQWQQMQGGTNAAGFGERARQQLFEFQSSWFGGMGAGSAEQLYQGAAELFPQDRAIRGRIQRFGQQAFTHFGMEVEDSLRLVGSAARAGAEDLRGLYDSLEHVRDVAVEAGVNAQVATDNFAAGVDRISRTFNGSAVFALASAQTAGTVGLGHQFENLQSTAYSDMDQLAWQAAVMGMTVPDYLAAIEEDPMVAVQGRSQQVLQTLAVSPQAAQTATEMAQDFLQGSDRTLTPGERHRIFEQLRESGQLPGPLQDPRTAVQFATSIGLRNEDGSPMDYADVEAYFVAQITGEAYTQEEAAVNAVTEASEPRDVGDLREQWAATRSGSLEDRMRASERLEDMGVSENDPISQIAARGNPEYGALVAGEAGMAYSYWTQQTGQTSPVIEQLLRAGDPDDMRLRVRSRNGDRILSLTEAMEVASDQLRAGTAEIVDATSESDIGMTVAEIAQEAGVQPESEEDVDMESVNEAFDVGQSEEEFRREQQAEDRTGGRGGGTVTLTASPYLRSLIEATGTGNVEIDPNLQSGEQRDTWNPWERPGG